LKALKIIGVIAAFVLGVVFVVHVPGMKSVYIGYIAASICICLPFVYWATAPDWWRSRAGRALMMLLGSLSALFIILIAGALFRDNTELREWLRYFVYSGVLVAGVRLAILFCQLRLGADWAKNRGEK
jgi:FlaA1/EpsC-like NDP-sugar epimerase